MQEHQAEVQSRWGDTEAFKESANKTKDYTKADFAAAAADAQLAVDQFIIAKESGLAPDSENAMAAAEAHRLAITKWFYTCSYEIQNGLADMYLADPRFTAFYENQRSGLAQYVHDAIKANSKLHS